MRMTFALPLLALGLAACQTYPADRYVQGPYGYPEPPPYQPYPPSGQGDYRPMGAHDLTNTNWRVVSVNGQPVPMSGHYFNFLPDRLSGRLGCNMIGGGYSVAGSTLRTGPLTVTQMRCTDMKVEYDGTRIMGQPMTLSESGDRLTLTNRLGTIELIRAR